VILGRRSSEPATAPETPLADEQSAAGKGRPTPKRSEARKARRNALPKNRKDATTQQRQRGREERRLARQALLTGDERHLPARDAGPQRRLARDVVDSRFTYGQIFFALIFAVFALSIVQNSLIRAVANIVALVSLTIMVVDGARNGRRAKKAVTDRFGAAEARGISSYAFMRALLPRRFRRPPPKVARGAHVG
jgi:hypothetical protein